MSIKHFRAITFVQRWWTAPNSFIGHMLGRVNRCSSRKIHDGITEYYDNPRLSVWGVAAIVFGNTINYGVGVDPDRVVARYDQKGLVILRDHEIAHVAQYRALGPAFLPAYLISELLARVFGRINALELAADDACAAQQSPHFT